MKLILGEFPFHVEIVINSLYLRERLEIGIITFYPLKN